MLRKSLVLTLALAGLAAFSATPAISAMSEREKIDLVAEASTTLFLYDKECEGLSPKVRAHMKTLTDALDRLGPEGKRAALVAFQRASADLMDFVGRDKKKDWCDLIRVTYVAAIEARP
jgi:hypothetical protein